MLIHRIEFNQNLGSEAILIHRIDFNLNLGSRFVWGGPPPLPTLNRDPFSFGGEGGGAHTNQDPTLASDPKF